MSTIFCVVGAILIVAEAFWQQVLLDREWNLERKQS
jgi:hypothetical protein